MLELFLQKSRGLVLGSIVLLLSAVFILQFGGPQAQGCSGSSGLTPAAQVYGEEISGADLRAAYLLQGGDRYPAELAKQNRLTEMVLYGLVEERLLARQARELGFYVTEDDVMEQVIEDGLIYVPMSVDASPYLPPAGPRRYDFRDSQGNFKTDNLKRFIQGGLQRSIRDFTEAQIQATLAQRMRETILASVEVGPTEAWERFVDEKDNATIEYARFSTQFFKSQIKADQTSLKLYMKDHADKVDAEYEAQKHRYTGLDKQVRARHILLKVDAGADEATVEQRRKEAADLRKRALAGEDFATLAAKYSEDKASARKGGDLGFNAKGRMVKPFDDAQFALAVGEISEPVKSDFGYHVIKVEGVREGDVPVDEAKLELAEGLYLEEQAKMLAENAAKLALRSLQDGRSLEEVSEAMNLEKEGEDPDPLAPKFTTSQPFGRSGVPVAGPFDGSKLTAAAFELTMDKPLPTEPMALGQEFIVYRLKDRQEAKREDFTPLEQDRIRTDLLNQRRVDVLLDYTRGLMHKAKQENKLLVDQKLLDAANGAA